MFHFLIIQRWITYRKNTKLPSVYLTIVITNELLTEYNTTQVCKYKFNTISYNQIVKN